MNISFATEQVRKQQHEQVRKIVGSWCEKNNFSAEKVKIVSALDYKEFLNQDKWGYSVDGVIYIPYDKTKEPDKARIEAVLTHESGHAVLWTEANVKSDSVFSEMYAMYLSDGGLQVADDRKTAASGFAEIFKVYCEKYKLSGTADDAKVCAIWCAQNLKAGSNPSWVEGASVQNSNAANQIKKELIQSINDQKIGALLPSDIHPTGQNASGGNNAGNSSPGSGGQNAMLPGRVILDGKTGSQSGSWDTFNK